MTSRMLWGCCLLAGLSLVNAYSNGPPINDTVCTDMIPTGHGASALTTPMPYEWILTDTQYEYGKKIRMQFVPSTNDSKFQYYEGFFVQARCTNDCSRKNMAIGAFETEDPQQRLNKCHDLENSAISHGVHDHFNRSAFYWVPPKDLRDPIRFRLTMVRKQSQFWVGVLSHQLTVKETSSGNTAVVSFVAVFMSIIAKITI